MKRQGKSGPPGPVFSCPRMFLSSPRKTAQLFYITSSLSDGGMGKEFHGTKSPARDLTLRQTQGGAGWGAGGPPRAHQGAVRQQPGHRHQQKQRQLPHHPSRTEIPAGDRQPHQSGGVPHPEGQHHVRGHPHHRQPGVLHGPEQTGGTGLLHGGGGLHGKEGGPGQHLLRRGTHGRENAPPPPVLHPHHGGRAAVRQGDFGQPGTTLTMAGRVPRPHEKGVPRPQAGRERPCHQAETHPHMAVQAIRPPGQAAEDD